MAGKHTHIWVTPCNLWYHTTSSQTLTLTQTKLLSCYFMVISGLCKRWEKGQIVGESNTVSSSVGGRRRGSFRKHYHVAYHKLFNCEQLCLYKDKSSGMWRDVTVTVVPRVSNEHSAFISKGQEAHHILADMNPQPVYEANTQFFLYLFAS